MVVFLGTLQLMLDRGQEVDWFAAPWVRWCALISAAGFVALRRPRARDRRAAS